jgi:carbon-monoxide dehydrogenase small subunit
MSESYSLLVDGIACTVDDADVDESLLFVLRERLGVTSVKEACSTGQCGACTVLVDGAPQCACLVLAATAANVPIGTLDGLAATPSITEVQGAFVDAGAVQCGFCTPGVVVQTHDLLTRVPAALAGNLCRCTGYGRIVAAAQLAAERLRERAG